MKEKDLKFLRGAEVKAIKKVSEEKKIRVKCDHRNHKGKSQLTPIEDKIFKCPICRAKVDTDPISLEELKENTAAVANAIQCIKAAYRGKSDVILEQLGFVLISLEAIPDWYKNVFLEKIAEAEHEEYRNEGINGPMFVNTNNFGSGNTGFEFGHAAKDKKKKKKHNDYKKKNKKRSSWDY